MDAIVKKFPAIARYIDHTLLAPDARAASVMRFCDEAIENGFCSVCVNGVFAPLVSARLRHA